MRELASVLSPIARPAEIHYDFESTYRNFFPFIWRTVRRLGIPDEAMEDVVQDVLVVVHRKLPEFEGRSSLKTWIYAIVRRVVRDQRRLIRKRTSFRHDHDVETLIDQTTTSADERMAKAEAVQTLRDVLGELDEKKREVFILAECEQMTAPEIAEAIGIPENTVYSRLRAARAEFDQAVAKHQARHAWRLK